MPRERSVKLLLIALGAAFLIVTGLKPLGLPYIPGARFSDAATSHWGAALFLQRSVMRDGEFPYWRDTILGGQPFAANPLNKTAYPPQWLALILPPALHLNVMIVLHLLIAGAGMWLLARSLGLGAWAAGVSVIAYVLSPRMIGHIGAGHIDIGYALAWLPCLLWAVKRAAGGSRRALWATGVFAGLMFIADMRVSLFGLALAAGWGGVLERWRVLRFLRPAIFFLLIASAVIIPLALWSPHLTRAALTPAEAGVFSLRPEYLLGVFIPQNHRNVEVLTYLGIVPLILALIGAVTNIRRVRFWLIAALIALLYALGSNGFFWNLLTQIAPILLWFRVPSRAWLIVTLVIALLAGYGVERLSKRPLQIGALLIIMLELTLTGRSWLEWRGEDAWLPADQRAIAERLIADGVDRVYSPTYSLEQQVAEWYEIDLFYGVDPFQLRSYVVRIQDFGGVQFDGYSVVQPPLIGAVGDDFSDANRGAEFYGSNGLENMGVSHVISAYPIERDQLRLLDQIDGVYIYSNLFYYSRFTTDWNLIWYGDVPVLLEPIALLIGMLAVTGGVILTIRAKT